MSIMQASSLLQNKTLEFPAPGMRRPRTLQSKKMRSPFTGKMIPEAVAEVTPDDDARTVHSRQVAAQHASD